MGKSLGPKSPQLEPQMQQYELIIRNEKTNHCNGCLNQFDRRNPKLYVTRRNEFDLHAIVNKHEDTNTMFPLYRIGFYVVKTIRYNGDRIWYITLYNITCFH